MRSLYTIVAGKIETEACEINVSEHCNLGCRGCSHLSPISARNFASPESVLRDLKILREFYHPAHIRLLGGEPLLHPDIVSVLLAVRESEITERIRLLTNGLLLSQMPLEFWQLVDEVHISSYPGQDIPNDKMQVCREQARSHNVSLKVRFYDKFRESYSEIGTQNSTLIERIYSSCQIAHVWRCHTVVDGYFFKCPQSYFLPKKLSNKLNPVPAVDGVEISNRSTFGYELWAYLNGEDPLTTCSHCLGSVGKLFPHAQIRRIAWTEPQRHSTEDLIDKEHLLLLEERNKGADNLCVRNETKLN